MREANAIRVEARWNSGEKIRAAIVKDNKGVIAFMKNTIKHPTDYNYIHFVVKHINVHDYILSLKR